METIISKSTGANTIETGDNDFFQDKAYHSGMMALMSIRNFSQELAKDYEQLIKLEGELEQMNNNATGMIEKFCTPQALDTWKKGLTEIHLNMITINQLITTAGEKAGNNSLDDAAGLWSRFDASLSHLQEVYHDLNDGAIAALPPAEYQHWNNDIFNLITSPLPVFATQAALCRLKLQMLQKYTPEELISINKMILDHIPDDFTFEEAAKYQKEYLMAMVDFTKEFREKKNLWDKFLDVLAGGTHQSPSERVMMDNWINGEKIEP
jgi:hypothetical protein